MARSVTHKTNSPVSNCRIKVPQTTCNNSDSLNELIHGQINSHVKLPHNRSETNCHNRTLDTVTIPASQDSHAKMPHKISNQEEHTMSLDSSFCETVLELTHLPDDIMTDVLPTPGATNCLDNQQLPLSSFAPAWHMVTSDPDPASSLTHTDTHLPTNTSPAWHTVNSDPAPSQPHTETQLLSSPAGRFLPRPQTR